MVFHDSRLVFHGSRTVFVVFHGFRMVFHCFRSVFMDFHGSRSVFMVPGRFSWFQVGFFHIENTIKLYSGPAIQSRPCRP